MFGAVKRWSGVSGCPSTVTLLGEVVALAAALAAAAAAVVVEVEVEVEVEEVVRSTVAAAAAAVAAAGFSLALLGMKVGEAVEVG